MAKLGLLPGALAAQVESTCNKNLFTAKPGLESGAPSEGGGISFFLCVELFYHDLCVIPHWPSSPASLSYLHVAMHYTVCKVLL